MVLENVVYILKHNCYRTLLVMKKQHYKLHTHIHYNYLIEVIRGKKKLLWRNIIEQKSI